MAKDPKASNNSPQQASAQQDALPLLLLVDDSEAILALEKAALGSTYRLETAVNGRLALEQMQRHVPDGVVLDLSMPEMDGDAVLIAMRQDPRLARRRRGGGAQRRQRALQGSLGGPQGRGGRR